MAFLAYARTQGSNYYKYGGQEDCKSISKKTCPIDALSLLAAILAGLCWVFLLVLLILKIVLNKPTLQKLDYIGHVVAGVVFFLASIIEILFLLMVAFGDYPCTYASDSAPENQYRDRSLNNKSRQSRPRQFNGYRYTRPPPPALSSEICSSITKEVFNITSSSVGSIICLIVGVFCILAAIYDKKGGRQPMGNRGGQPSQANWGAGDRGVQQQQQPSTAWTSPSKQPQPEVNAQQNVSTENPES